MLFSVCSTDDTFKKPLKVISSVFTSDFCLLTDNSNQQNYSLHFQNEHLQYLSTNELQFGGAISETK